MIGIMSFVVMTLSEVEAFWGIAVLVAHIVCVEIVADVVVTDDGASEVISVPAPVVVADIAVEDVLSDCRVFVASKT